MGDSAPETIKDAIDQSAKGPKSVSVDGVITTEHSIKDLIEADDHLRERESTGKKTLPIRFGKIKPGGAA